MDMNHLNYTKIFWDPDDLSLFEDDLLSDLRNSTSTFNTHSSEGSSGLPAIYSNSDRSLRAPSLASSHTSYSSLPQLPTDSWPSTTSDAASVAYDFLIRPTSNKTTLKQKQATNPYACSHCSLTFTKKSDRKKHVSDVCPYLGSGLVCPKCSNISRNIHQVRRHRRDYGHEGQCKEIDFSKRALTCSNDGIIYRTLEDYLDHFSSPACILNRFDGERHHRSRLRTLLSEGRDDRNGHSYIYAALVRYCQQHALPSESCNRIIDSLLPEIAQSFAERLEWGCVPDDGSARSKLGYNNFDAMVLEIMSAGVGLDSYRHSARASSQSYNSVVPGQQHYPKHDSTQLSLDDTGASPIPQTPKPTVSSIRIRRNIPLNPINTSKSLPPIPPSPNHRLHTLPDQPIDQSAAVTAATAMLREQSLPHRQKRTRPAGSPGESESSKLRDLRPSPNQIGQSRRMSDDWPEFHSLTPSPPAEQVRQRRQAGSWKMGFEEFVAGRGVL